VAIRTNSTAAFATEYQPRVDGAQTTISAGWGGSALVGATRQGVGVPPQPPGECDESDAEDDGVRCAGMSRS